MVITLHEESPCRVAFFRACYEALSVNDDYILEESSYKLEYFWPRSETHVNTSSDAAKCDSRDECNNNCKNDDNNRHNGDEISTSLVGLAIFLWVNVEIHFRNTNKCGNDEQTYYHEPFFSPKLLSRSSCNLRKADHHYASMITVRTAFALWSIFSNI